MSGTGSSMVSTQETFLRCSTRRCLRALRDFTVLPQTAHIGALYPFSGKTTARKAILGPGQVLCVVARALGSRMEPAHGEVEETVA